MSLLSSVTPLEPLDPFTDPRAPFTPYRPFRPFRARDCCPWACRPPGYGREALAPPGVCFVQYNPQRVGLEKPRGERKRIIILYEEMGV